MMLVHIGQPDVAELVHNAWLVTLEEGVHTYDIYDPAVSKEKVGTKEFAQAVAARLGRRPRKLKAVSYARDPQEGAPKTSGAPAEAPLPSPKRELKGVDVYVNWESGDSDALAAKLGPLAGPEFKLTMLTSRGVKVWPDGFAETFRGDQFRCRHMAAGGGALTHSAVAALLGRLSGAGLAFAQAMSLYDFDGERGYSLGQGE
jgi:isocitrate dehydrogenase